MEAANAKGAPYQLWVGAGVLFVLAAAANMASPLYPVYQQLYDMSDMTMTGLYAAYILTALPALLLFGSAADAFGRRPVLLAGLGCAFLGTALFAADAIGVPGLFLGRVILGLGLGLATGAGIALMVEASPVWRPALGSTAATVSFVSGSGVGLIMAGAIIEGTGGRTSAPFVVMLAALLVMGLMVYRLQLHRPVIRQRWRPTWPTVPHQIRASFGIAASTGFLGWAALGLFLALLPSLAESSLPGSNTLITGAVVGSVLIVSAACQLVAPRFEPRAAQTIGLTLLGLGSALLLSSNISGLGEFSMLAVMTLAAIVTGAGHGLSYWGANREIDILAPSTQRAGITAALYLAFYAGTGVPAIGVGLLTATGASLTGAILIFTLGLLLATIAFLPLPSLTLTTIRRPRAKSHTN